MTTYLLLALSTVSIFFNFYLFLKLSKKKIKATSPKDDMRLLSDLMTNNRTLIEIKRIAPQEYFIRRS